MRISIWVLLVVATATAACSTSYEPPAWIRGLWSTDRDATDNNRADWRFTSDNIVRTLVTGGTPDETDFMELSGKYREESGGDFYQLINPISPEDKEWGHLFEKRDDEDELDWHETSSLGELNEGPLYRIE